MSSELGTNPWLSIWTQPRKTIRAVINKNPKHHFFYLATVYALQSILFYASYFSLGLSYHFAIIVILSLVLAPFIGAAMIYVNSWFFYFTGKWLGGKAPFLHIRAAFAWSKVPLIVNILMWFILLVFSSDYIFIQYSNGPAPIFINLVMIIASVWSLVLLIQNIREVQGFSLLRSVFNLILAYVVIYILLFALLWLYSFFYGLAHRP